ncbi:hypothetical protein ACIRPQ_20555 [Streptomyces sp. NPDC101213]|uniref:hypothetical protein n=1 Tax=Streptomyces sp. NPDC101213 TaxID=3366130 RepID=UPI003820CFA3
MPDRSLRLLTLPPQSPQGGERGAVLLRERPATPPDASTGRANGDGGSSPKDSPPGGSAPDRSSPDHSSQGGSSPDDDNPFAPPPEGTPDRPWQPRRPARGAGEPPSGNSPWGSQWSDRQPGRSGGGFGERPGGPPEDGPGSGPAPTPRWDPTDPSQRRARYALLCGMWAFFFALFGWPYVALLLGALALNWGISALRAKPRTPDPDNPQPPARPQTTAAVSGIVTASLALALVALTFTAQLVYHDYYTCTSDALTNESKQACTDLLPTQLRNVLGGNS